MMRKKPITFANGNRAVVITASRDASTKTILDALGITSPRAVILLFGGAAGLDDSRKTRLAELFRDAIAPVAAELGALIIDGGTQSGVMAMMGEAAARVGRRSQLLGIAPAGKVTYPSGPNEGGIPDGAPLEPNHSHFILVDSDEWGGETGTMLEIARAFKTTVVAVLVNGGRIAAEEALQSVRNGWELLVVEGSGRFADELSVATHNATLATSGTIKEITRSGRVELFSIDEPVAGLKRQLQQILHAG